MSSRALLEGSDSESDGEGKNEDDTDSNMPSKNFAILLVEKLTIRSDMVFDVCIRISLHIFWLVSHELHRVL